MRRSAALDMLCSFEARFPVDEWQVGDLRVWPIARHQLYWATQGSSPAPRKVASVATMAKTAWGALVSNVLDARHRAARVRADVLLLGHTSDRIRLEQSWYDRFMEPVAETLRELGQRSVHLEIGETFRRPRHDASRLVQPALDLRRVGARLTLTRPPRTSLPAFDEVSKWLSSEGLAPGTLTAPGLVHRAVQIEWFSRYFESVLRRTGARAAVLTDYDAAAMALHLACHRLDIPSVEVQHGLQGSHFAYVGWTRVPASGYELLPTVYWTWSEAEAAAIRSWADKVVSAHRVVVGGNLFLNRWLHGHDQMVTRFDEVIAEIRGPRRQHEVLCSLQHTLCSPEDLQPIVKAVATSSTGWRYWIRTHPLSSSLELRAVRHLFAPFADRSVIVEAADIPLYALLRHVDANVTISSSTVIEAAAFGVPSVCLDRDAAEMFEQQVESGWAVIASPDGVKNALATHITRMPVRARPGSLAVSGLEAMRSALGLCGASGA